MTEAAGSPGAKPGTDSEPEPAASPPRRRTALDPTGPELAAKNRRLVAEKQHWPEGVVETCEALAGAHPEWYIDWARPGSPTYPVTGYYGARWSRERGEPMVYGATPEELEAAIEAHPWGKSVGEYRPIIWPARD